MARYQHTKTETRIRAAIGNMPYGAMTAVSKAADLVGFNHGGPLHDPAPVTLESIADYLFALANVLHEAGEKQRTEHNELVQLRGDVEAVRRLFGIKVP